MRIWSLAGRRRVTEANASTARCIQRSCGTPRSLSCLQGCNKYRRRAVMVGWGSRRVAMKRLSVWAVGLLALVAGSANAGNWIAAPAGSPVGLMHRLDRAKWIGMGAKSAERVVYVFTDPDCPFCNDLWKAMQKARAPDVQIRYLLVAVIDADSKGKDVAILEAKDPVAAFE